MIVLEGAHARAVSERGKPDSRLADVTLQWERGVLAVLGTRVDGTTALLEVLAGIVPARSGVATVFGKPPAESRPRIAHVPLEPTLPDALRVDELCDLASRIRGETPVSATSRLAPLGIEKLADRRVRSLSRGESRAVSLALALSSGAPLLLLEEPLSGLDPAASGRATAALRARAAAGAAVVVTTSSVREATSLADQLAVLVHGVFTHLPPSLAHAGPGGARLRIVVAASTTSEASPLVAALTEDAAIKSIETTAFASTNEAHAAVAVVVTGPDLLAVARAVGLAAAKSGASVEAIESAVMPLDAIRARVAVPRPGMVMPRPRAVPPGSEAASSSQPPGVAPSGAPPSGAPPSGAPPSGPPGGTA